MRELRNALELGAALAEDGTIRLADLPEALGEAQPQPWSVPSLASDAPPAQSEAEDAETLRALLLACRWNVSEAARRLGCDRTTVHRRMRRLGLAQPQ